MSNRDAERDDVLTELLIKQASEGLTAEEQAELTAMDSSYVAARRQSLEMMLGAVSAALVEPLESPTKTLRSNLEIQAAQHFERLRSQTAVAASIRVAVDPPRARWAWLSVAACLVLAVVGWMRPPRTIVAPAPVTVQVNAPPMKVTTPKAPSPVLTPAQLRDALLARDDVVKVNLDPTKDPAATGVSADVVWDPQTNSGFLHVSGLKSNDPAITQYQAWVFDSRRDKRYPLDCALFNVSAESSELVIPIQTSIPVRMAKAFAITVEQAGGVVVPDKAHVVALGSIG